MLMLAQDQRGFQSEPFSLVMMELEMIVKGLEPPLRP